MSELPPVDSAVSSGGSRGRSSSRDSSSQPRKSLSPMRAGRSLVGAIMRTFSGGDGSGSVNSNTDEHSYHSSSGSFKEQMRQRQNLLHSLLNKSTDLRSPSAPSSTNSSPHSSPRSSSRINHRIFRGDQANNVVGIVPTSPGGTRRREGDVHPSPRTAGRRSDLVKGYYDSDESGSFSAQSSHRSLVSTVTGGSSTTASLSASFERTNSTKSSENSSGSGSEKAHSMYIKDFSFEIDLKELTFVKDSEGENRIIGEGNFAKIHLASWNGTPCAVKRMSAKQAGRMALEKFQGEIALMMGMRHPNIVQIYGGCWPQEEGGRSATNLFTTCIVMEHCAHGSLFDVMQRFGREIPWYSPDQHTGEDVEVDAMLAAVAQAAEGKSGGGSFSTSVVKDSFLQRDTNLQFKFDWCRQIARGMAYLHSAKNPIMHRDLKCSNVLVSKGYQMKISDFGESRRRQKHLDMTECQTMSQAGTLLFMAPEMVTEYDYDISIDVYSFAVLLIEMFTDGDLLHFYKLAPALAMHKAVGGWRPSLDSISKELPDLTKLIEKCWAQNPSDRPTFNDVLADLNDICADFDGLSSRRSSDFRLSGD
ncbi:hypothetical protein TrST_g2439 [Triparma strigata]|uniref:Protein kinase domain-containing protein n=1 Tax=Triparma strigata TaxID=1606541 RepID=A0A9W6ZRJ6_9STRA|nr:hypothetical protein TrST_g2439 [Triparma strigata]